MKIKDHLLWMADSEKVPYHLTPNKSGIYKPKYLVVHYTAATTASSTINWFAKKEAKASAHLLIDREGNITQFAPFNIITWHAGQSNWEGLGGLNAHSIGIELVNGGKLLRTETGWICPVDRRKIPNDDVVIARHKNEAQETGWHEYTAIQIETAIEVAALLVEKYKLKDVLGHDDIAPFRKSDPGPAFPLASFRSRVIGRHDDDLESYQTTAAVNIRSGAGTEFAPLTDALPKGTTVQLLKRLGNWSFVEVTGEANGMLDLEGWVFSKYLSRL